MSFERIKTVKGKKYKYLVESVRENGKVKQKIVKYLGRVDREHKRDGYLTLAIPYGFYYFAQDGCEACDSPEQVDYEFGLVKEVLKEEMPDLRYINLSKEENPLPIPVHYTPTLVEICSKGVYMGDSFLMMTKNWLVWRFGKQRGLTINKAYNDIWDQRIEEITKYIREGKKKNQLLKIGYNELDVLGCLDKIKREKRMEKREARHKAWLQSNTQEEMEKAAKEHSRDAVIAKLKQEEARLKAELEQPVEEDKPVKEGEYPPDCYFYCYGCHESFKIGNNTKCLLCGSEKIVENDLLNKCDYKPKPKPLKEKLLFCPGGEVAASP